MQTFPVSEVCRLSIGALEANARSSWPNSRRKSSGDTEYYGSF
jgi:hypothetical protein